MTDGIPVTGVPEVLFVCVHNAGRSQMAAALLDHHARGRVQVRSAGSAPADEINPAVIAVMDEIGLDISKERPKPLTDEAAQAADVIVTMGCGDACPVHLGKRYLDWELPDPAGQSVDVVRRIRDEIDRRVRALLEELVPTHNAAVRLSWEALPPGVRNSVEGVLGASVVHASSRPGGYSPSMAASCRLSDDSLVFIKAVSPEQNPQSPEMLRLEARVTAALPQGAPAPTLLHLLDDGCWVVAVFEHVTGELPHIPWLPGQLSAVLNAVWNLAHVEPPPSLPTIEERYGPLLNGWRNLAASPGLDGALDDWSARHLDRLASLEPGWVEAASGDDLVHGDVRGDNVLLQDGRVTFVDWPAACVGRVLFDVVSMLPSVALQGGGDPEAVLRAHGRPGTDPDAVTALLVADAGYFLDRARLPHPPGLPTVRAFQRDQAEICVRWLRTRLGWP